MPTLNINGNIRTNTAAGWGADATVYTAKTILVTTDATYGATDQRKFKIADGVQTWTNLDYFPVSGYDDATSSIQTQLNGKQATLTNPVTGTGTTNEITYFTAASTVASLPVATYPSLTELSYVKGATSSIQNQLDAKTEGDISYYRKTGTTTVERWYTSASTVHAATTVALTKDVLRATPFIVSETMTLDRIAMEITSAGTAASLVRIGIYSSTNCLPTALVLDAGTIAGDSATFQSITINQQLTPGLYFLTWVTNSAANITFRAITVNTGIPTVLGVTNNLGANNPANLVSSTFIYSTLPDPFDNTGITVNGLNVATVSVRRSA